ncbi:MAG: methanogenesis marker protein Mmp4/MtxX [Candidatus Thermoplasmatota archaeon]|nr:methanogenesis marker protein Mmp4/MtxX [Candidatus Thermoplasmatota archaeon]
MDIDVLLARGCSSDMRVGIGLPESAFGATQRRLRSSECGIRLERFGDARELVRSLRSEDLDAAVRGTLSSSAVLTEIRGAFGIDEVMRAAIMGASKTFVLAPVGIDEGMEASSRLRLAMHTLRYFAGVGWRLRVGVLSKGRPEDRSRGSEIERSIDDGDSIAAALAEKGFEARHCGILVEEAIKDCDFVLSPDGVSGNLMFRTLHFVGGAKAYGAPVVDIERVFVDTSRAKEDFSEPIMLAAALAVHPRARQGRA